MVMLIFSQEKLIFFEQIQPLGVTRYPSISLNVSEGSSLCPAVARRDWQRLEPSLTLATGFPGNHTGKKGRRSLVGLPKAGSLRVRSLIPNSEIWNRPRRRARLDRYSVNAKRQMSCH